MMKLARLICLRCRTPYQVAVELKADTARCPFCGQANPVPETAPPITGLCALCGRALDDHVLTGSQTATCPA